jgi:hypothetical protein
VYELFTKPLNKVEYDAVVLGVFGSTAAKDLLKLYPFDTTPGECVC